jgi:hypothetical protein
MSNQDSPKAVNQINKPATPPVVMEKSTEILIANEAAADKPSSDPVPENKKPMIPADRVPSNWHIQETDKEDIVHCQNNQTHRVFVGTRKEFSALIKE